MKNPLYQSPLGDDLVCSCWRFPSGCSFRAHWHSEIEIIFVQHGTAVVMVEGVKYTLTENSLLFIGSADIHEVVSTSEDSCLLFMEMGYNLLGKSFRVFTEIELVERRISFDTFKSRQSPLYALLSKIDVFLNETQAFPPDVVTLRKHALLYDFAVTVLECCPYRRIEGKRGQRIEQFLAMYNAVEYVAKHYGEQLDVAAVAKLSGYEYSRFCQLFKRTIGIPFHRYLSEHRIEEAKRLLYETGASISAIAEAVGIPETKTFTRLFKSIVGVPPTVYRKMNR